LSTLSRTRDFSRTTLSARHRPVVRGLAEAMFSADGEVDPARLDAFVGEVDHFISHASKTLRFGLRLMLDVVRWLPVFLIRRWSLFENLPRGEKVRMLEAMECSNVVLVALVLVAYKTIMTMIFYEDPAELRDLGYTGPERQRYKKGLLLTTHESVARP
jgi:hypothetical protein